MRSRTTRPAGAAVEFALVLPVLVTLVLGCVDFGRFAVTYIAVTNAARSGAGYGGDHPYTPATLPTWQRLVRQTVADEMRGLNGYDDSQLVVTATATTETDGTWLAQVEVSYPFQTVANWPGIPAVVTLRQVVVQRGVRP